MRRRVDIAIALITAAICHGTFLLGVSAMAIGLASGMAIGAGRIAQPWGWVVNAVLALQFPLLHSALLTRRGQRLTAAAAGTRRGRTLATTVFATIAAAQLVAVFVAWTPSGRVWWQPAGAASVVAYAAYAGSWLFLTRAIWDSGLALQTGATGWLALLRGRPPQFPSFATRGLFQRCRQPIYVGFLLTLWTAPGWSPDRALITVVWSAYCVLGPLLKEGRFLRRYGVPFARYQRRVPYMIPSLRSEHS